MPSFLSVGIDVGTTSTHLTFTRLTVVNVALVNQSPLPKIENREIIFQSDVHLTPLTTDGNIDADAVYALVDSEYKRAKIRADEIKVGAAIVTGETALKRNARDVIEKLCLLSGDLVAVSAGPHLEAVLAARGSGAVAASQQKRSTILNVDIGGGTMNLALYKNGNLISTHCLGIGGRCVQVQPLGNDEFEIVGVNPSGDAYLPDRYGFSTFSPSLEKIAKGDRQNSELKNRISHKQLLKLVDDIAADVVDFINQDVRNSKLKNLPLTSFENNWHTPDEIWLCGGVCELMLNPEIDRFKFNDLGGLLADALVANFESANIAFKIPPQPIRATVTGAGMYSMQVSGSTIDFDIDELPLRNIPLVRPFEDSSQLFRVDDVEQRITASVNRMDSETSFKTIAIEMPNMETSRDYLQLKKIATCLASAAKNNSRLRPFVLVLQEDLGMALGQLFRQSYEGEQETCPLIVLDGITTSDGDFLDIGKPVSLDSNGIARTVPVVLKTLVFG